jgi:hypothetical protein
MLEIPENVRKGDKTILDFGWASTVFDFDAVPANKLFHEGCPDVLNRSSKLYFVPQRTIPNDDVDRTIAVGRFKTSIPDFV